MLRISTKSHAAADYATGALLLLRPQLTGARDGRTQAILRGVGAAAVGQALVTDWELGAAPRLSVQGHRINDAATGATLLASPWVLGLRGRGASAWLPAMLVGVVELAAAVLSEGRPSGDAGRTEAQVAAGAAQEGALHTAPVPGSPTEHEDQRPGALRTPSGDAPAAEEVAGLRPDIAPAPVEAPGPSVPASGPPASTTEVQEQVDRTVPDAEELGVADADPIDQLAAREEAAAAAEAAAIGGPVAGETNDDPAMRPVYEAGGGPQEGFEEAEELLVENASHGDGRGDPLRDAFRPEAESDRSTAEYGEPDQRLSDSAETPLDPENEDAGEGPRRGAL